MKRKTNLWSFIIVLLIILMIIIILTILYLFPNKINPCNYNDSNKSYIKKDPNCFVNYACILGTEAFKDECGCGCKKIDSVPTESDCKNHSYTDCPSECVVCPPCTACSSLSCNTKEFCNSIGFNDTWYSQTSPHTCTPESRNAQVCNDIYMPVCGWFSQNIKCIKYPCANTYPNSCNACKDKNVEYYVDGECPK